MGSMLAVTIPQFGDESVLKLDDVALPVPADDEVLLRVHAAGVNRADVSQRQGHYPPPPGESEVPGLEVSGTVEAVGASVVGWNVGDEACALLAGGGYAEFAAVPVGQLLPVPQGVDLTSAAGLPEVTCTVWSNLFFTADLRPGELLLIHGGSSGIGTMAIQMAKAFGATVAVTAGSAEKLAVCKQLGADILINYNEEDFVEVVRNQGGANVILDVVGAKYLARNVEALATSGRLVIIGMMGGSKAELNIGALISKRCGVAGTSLRSRPKAEKAAIVQAVREKVWPLVEAGTIRPVTQSTYPIAQVADAHREMAASKHIGKILLTV